MARPGSVCIHGEATLELHLLVSNLVLSAPDAGRACRLKQASSSCFAVVARFDGDGMVHAVRIKDGAVTYTNKFVRTQRFMKEQKLGHPAYSKVPELTTLGVAFCWLQPPGCCSAHVIDLLLTTRPTLCCSLET